ncbi:MAG: recombinase RecT [Candidatus Aenigmarchaeota archaeon]|nr:recombinase RecT [Candidatus Aenigmarchaeota archaeon]
MARQKQEEEKKKTRKRKAPNQIKNESEVAIVKREEQEDISLERVNALYKLGTALYKSEMFPNVKSSDAAIAIIEYGRELGLKPVVALQTMSVINGRICIEAKALLSLAIQNGIKIKILEKSRKGAKVEFKREGFEKFVETFTFDDAKAAGIIYDRNGKIKANWKAFPEEMCYWRCIAKGLRAYAPDLIMGLYIPEEILDSPIGKEEEIKSEPKNIQKVEEQEVIDVEVEEEVENKEEQEEEKIEEKQEEEIPELDEKEIIIRNIKEDFKIRFGSRWEDEYKNFKKFLKDFNEVKKRKFVGVNQWGHLSLHEGETEDLKLILNHLGWVLGKWAEWEKKNQDQPEIPF